MLFVWGVIVVGLLTTGLSAIPAFLTPAEPWHLLGALLLCLGADRPLLDLRFGHNRESFTWAEACVVIGLVLVPGTTLVLCAAVAVLAFHLAMRRSPIKAAFNAMSFAIGIAIATGVENLVFSAASHSEGVTLIAVGLAALGFATWNALTTTV